MLDRRPRQMGSWPRGCRCCTRPAPRQRCPSCTRPGCRGPPGHWGSGQKTCVTLCFLAAVWQAGHVLEACGGRGAGHTRTLQSAPTHSPPMPVRPGCPPGGTVASRPGSGGSCRRGTGKGLCPLPRSQDMLHVLQGGCCEHPGPAQLPCPAAPTQNLPDWGCGCCRAPPASLGLRKEVILRWVLPGCEEPGDRGRSPRGTGASLATHPFQGQVGLWA